MDTTCGSFALTGAKAKKNAAVVDLLIKAGMIIIAKTNLTVGCRLSSKYKPMLIPSPPGARRNERLNGDQWMVCGRWTGDLTIERFTNAWLTALLRLDRLMSEVKFQKLPS